MSVRTQRWRDTFEDFQLRTGFPNFFVFEPLRRGKNGRAEDQIWKRGQKKLEKEKESEKGESAVTKPERTEKERKSQLIQSASVLGEEHGHLSQQPVPSPQRLPRALRPHLQTP